MATRTITRLHDTCDETTRAVRALESAGVPHDHISLVGSAHDRATEEEGGSKTDAAATGAGAGATLGTLVGGAGLLAGIGALAIPGVGPIVAAGWLMAALTGVGAAAGGLLGSLTGAGVSEEDAHVYA